MLPDPSHVSKPTTVCIYLSLGSNLGDKEANLRAAIKRLGSRICVKRVSSFYETAPVGILDQPPFLNLVLEADTDLSPFDLLDLVKGIERDTGRTPNYRWGPRVIDIDILLYSDRIVETPELAIPHARMHERAFVLCPLSEIAPHLRHPVLAGSMEDWARSVSTRGVRRSKSYSP